MSGRSAAAAIRVLMKVVYSLLGTTCQSTMTPVSSWICCQTGPSPNPTGCSQPA